METTLELLAEGLNEFVDLQVVVANQSAQEVKETRRGVKVHRLFQYLKVASTSICPALLSTMYAAKADIVHLHIPNPLALLTYSWGRVPGKLIIGYHSDIIKQRFLNFFLEPLQIRALLRASAIVASSQDLIRSSPVLQKVEHLCEVIPLTIPLTCFDPANQEKVRELQSRFSGPIVLAVGRFVYYKGFEVLIRAFAQVRSTARLLIIGEGPLRKKMEELVGQLGLRDRVHFLGNVDETAPYYELCDLFVLSSVARSETFGVVQLEAMARSKPVINTALDSGVQWVSRHQETGLTVPIGDAAAMARAIDELIQNPVLRQRYGAAAKARVLQEFTSDIMIRKTLALYERIAS
jgi:rhamnosyl/mannosyltransferase